MKKSVLAAAVLVAALAMPLAAQTPMYGVRVNADKHANFSSFKTYSWTPSQPASSRTVDAQIVAAIDHELSALGLTKAASGAGDVIVTYSALAGTDAGQDPGTLVVGMLEPGRRKAVLQLRTDRPVAGADISGAVAALFEHYPTRMKG